MKKKREANEEKIIKDDDKERGKGIQQEPKVNEMKKIKINEEAEKNVKKNGNRKRLEINQIERKVKRKTRERNKGRRQTSEGNSNKNYQKKAKR